MVHQPGANLGSMTGSARTRKQEYFLLCQLQPSTKHYLTTKLIFKRINPNTKKNLPPYIKVNVQFETVNLKPSLSNDVKDIVVFLELNVLNLYIHCLSVCLFECIKLQNG